MTMSSLRLDATTGEASEVPWVTLLDFEVASGGHMSDAAFDYVRSGADDEVTLRENRAAFERICIYHRVMVDVSRRDLTRTLLGRRLGLPVIVAPLATPRLVHPDAEREIGRAIASAGTIMILSTLNRANLADLVKLTDGAVWFGVLPCRDRGVTRALIERAEAAGCEAIVLTVDAPVLGRRDRDLRNQFTLPRGLRIADSLLSQIGDGARDGDEAFADEYDAYIDASFSWSDLEWIASVTRLPIFIKGVVRVDDARRAVAEGVRGIVVSNHGGRQLDTSPPTIAVLPAIADAVGGDVDLLVDGGVRRGTDILKALALGAHAVLVGRPVLWGLATHGAAGVERVLSILREELDRAMALTGCASLADVTRELVQPTR
jgi:4-hydroxymandelate oxidase